jgi:NAD(P)H-dependent FMN reductase
MPADRSSSGTAASLLAVCGSLKPAAGRSEPSACRELLKLALAPVAGIYPSIETLDLREACLPPFDGREPWEYGHPELVRVRTAVEAAAGYVFSVPAYWGGIGAAFKNFVETVCGPGYDAGHTSPFAGKPAAALIVGSGPGAAQAATPQIQAVLDALGVRLVAPPVIVGDPHQLPETARAVQELTAAAAAVVLALPPALATKSAAEQ